MTGTGGNYGRRCLEGIADFDTTAPAVDPSIALVAAYSHPGQAGETGLLEAGLSVTDGHVYRGSSIPDLQVKYIFGDWYTNFG